MKCPNCENDAYAVIGSAAMRRNILQQCRKCGTSWDEHGWSLVPERSRPVVPVELPTESGLWWRMSYPPDVLDVAFDRSQPRINGTDIVLGRDRYVKATPPIVAKPPEPTAAEDAWHLRHIAANVHMSNVQKSQLERIAVRIEASGKEVK